MPHSVKLTPENLKECENVKRLLRIEKQRTGMTHKILGTMIGKSDKTIAAIVNGRMRVTVDVARRLADVFGVPLHEILPWTAELSDMQYLPEFIEAFQELSPDNREVGTRLILRLLKSQQESPAPQLTRVPTD